MSGRAWCFVENTNAGLYAEGWDYCDIPSCDTSSCEKSDPETCGCESVYRSDYRGNISSTLSGDECSFWENFLDEPTLELVSNYDVKGNNFCRSFDQDGPFCFTDSGRYEYCDVAVCNPCSCIPPCGEFNYTESCSCPQVLQSDHCCDEDDSECKCTYLREACLYSLQDESTEYCDAAAIECCGNDDFGCKCSLMESLCLESDMGPCLVGGEYCCASYQPKSISWDGYFTCKCDYFTHVASVLSNAGSAAVANQYCDFYSHARAENLTEQSVALKHIYITTGGDHWHNNSGWFDDETSQCDSFGVFCSSDGIVTRIDLRGNNLTGPFPSKDISMMRGLQILDLANNSLSGVIDYNALYSNSELFHVDLSSNNLAGMAELLFSQSVQYLNLSHNSFDYINSMKSFHSALKTLEYIDLSFNNIIQDVKYIFGNIVPSRLIAVYLSDNQIYGTLPSPIPTLDQLTILSMANNNMTGTLPDFARSLPELRTLDLSNQKEKGNGFTGSISASISTIRFLSELNLANNRLTNSIPPEVSDLSQLRYLNVSLNELSNAIPANYWLKIEGMVRNIGIDVAC